MNFHRAEVSSCSFGHRFVGAILVLVLTVGVSCRHSGQQPPISRYDLQKAFPGEERIFSDRIAFGLVEEVYIVDASGVKGVRTRCAHGVAWSPGGDALLIDCKQPGSNPLHDLVIISGNDWSNWEYVQKDIIGLRGMDWSPDGNRIVFAGTPADTLYEVRDGSRVFHFGVEGIYVIEKGGINRRLVVRCTNCCSPVWSPDGTYIAFISQEGLEIVEPNDPDHRRLVYTFLIEKPAVCYGKNASWFPDSQRLLISDGLRIRVLNLRDGSVSTLFEIDPLSAEGYIRAMVLPDGQHIMYQAFYKELTCNAELACSHYGKIMFASLSDMVWREITPDIQNGFISSIDWWQDLR